MPSRRRGGPRMPHAHPRGFPPRWLKNRFFYRSAGACPPRALSCTGARRGTGPCPTVRERRFFPRSAGACPPRSLSCTRARRGTGPRPTVTGRRFFYRSAGACPPRSLSCTRARRGTGPRPTVTGRRIGPSVVCDRLITNGSGSGDPDLQRWAQCLPVGGTSLSRYETHRDQEVSPTGKKSIYETTSFNYTTFLAFLSRVYFSIAD